MYLSTAILIIIQQQQHVTEVPWEKLSRSHIVNIANNFRHTLV